MFPKEILDVYFKFSRLELEQSLWELHKTISEGNIKSDGCEYLPWTYTIEIRCVTEKSQSNFNWRSNVEVMVRQFRKLRGNWSISSKVTGYKKVIK